VINVRMDFPKDGSLQEHKSVCLKGLQLETIFLPLFVYTLHGLKLCIHWDKRGLFC